MLARWPGSLSIFPAVSAVVRKLTHAETSLLVPFTLDSRWRHWMSVSSAPSEAVHIPEAVGPRRHPDLM